MIKNSVQVALLAIIMAGLTSCSAIAGIFKAGMGFGIFMVILVIGLIIFIASRMGKK